MRSFDCPERGARVPVTAVAALTAVAGAVHLGLGVRHGQSADGLLFVVVGAAQAALALLLHQRPRRMHLIGAFALNLGVAGAWALTYGTTGTGRADITAAGLTATVLEVTAALLALAVRRRARVLAPAGPPRAGGAAVVGVAAAALAFGWTGHDHHHHDHHGPPLEVTTAGAEAPLGTDPVGERHRPVPGGEGARVEPHDHLEPQDHAAPHDH